MPAAPCPAPAPFFCPLRTLDILTRKHTAFPSFRAMVEAPGGYVPTIRLDLMGQHDGLILAASYNRATMRGPALVSERRNGWTVSLTPFQVALRAAKLRVRLVRRPTLPAAAPGEGG